jgi:acetylornithine deacetylase
VSFGTEAPFFNAAGLRSIVLGPGDIAVAHQPNERIELATIPRAVELIAQLVGRFCVGN